MKKKLLTYYLNTNYSVFDPAINIYIGQSNEALLNLLRAHNVQTWAYLTAENPRSEQKTNEENKILNEALEQDLIQDNYSYFLGAGIPKNSNWTPENSFLVLGMDKKTGIELATKYQQNAFIYGGIKHYPEVVYGYY
ncbi:MAG: Uncharacterised protein [SAR116 cluster bacterium]|nr:MAG: Uncharacterised protein [SAR116 cluster bacterium]